MDNIDAKTLSLMMVSAYNNLDNKKQEINVLNVFPVPDGDTGTNMSLTMRSAVQELSTNNFKSVYDVAKKMSDALLRGARGNSGVITSLLFRGFAQGLRGVETADAAALSIALSQGVTAAYKAVMKPTEGTMLTVAREAAEGAALFVKEEKDVVKLMAEVVRLSKESLERTPELLPVLKQAGVVDSGGVGIVTIYEGMLYCLETGKVVEPRNQADVQNDEMNGKIADFASINEDDILFGYCTEFIIEKSKGKNADSLAAYYDSIGDSVVVVEADDIVKVHVHTNNPDKVLARALEIGAITDIKIDNLKEQHREMLGANGETNGKDAAAQENEEPKPPQRDYGFVTVAAGEGFKEVFENLAVDYVVNGGQTMNPSTQDILYAVSQTPASTVFVFPNNKNIIWSAEQAIPLSKDKKIVVIPTTTVPQGITAMLVFDEMAPAKENESNMCGAMGDVTTGQMTFAVRDSELDGLKIKKNEYLGLLDNKLSISGKDLSKTALGLIEKMAEKSGGQLLTVFYGEDVDESAADEMVKKIEEKFPQIEINLIAGGQPIYYYIFALE